MRRMRRMRVRARDTCDRVTLCVTLRVTVLASEARRGGGGGRRGGGGGAPGAAAGGLAAAAGGRSRSRQAQQSADLPTHAPQLHDVLNASLASVPVLVYLRPRQGDIQVFKNTPGRMRQTVTKSCFTKPKIL